MCNAELLMYMEAKLDKFGGTSRERSFSNSIVLQNLGSFLLGLSNQVACDLLLPLTLLKIVSKK